MKKHVFKLLLVLILIFCYSYSTTVQGHQN